jgi:multicomponent K+:H+ antiporter subunit A
VLNALAGRPRDSIVTPFYEQNSKPGTGAADIVGAIVVDFRGFDTMIEITVFGMAGAAVYALLRHASRKHDDFASEIKTANAVQHSARAKDKSGWRDIGSLRGSPMLHTLARIVLPVAVMVAFTHMAYGHDQPGDGFTAGVIVSIALGLMMLAFGRAETLRQLPWLRPAKLIGAGWLVVMIGSLSPLLIGQPFFSPVDYGVLLNLPLPANFSISASFLFELAICLTVIGSATWLLISFAPIDAEPVDVAAAAAAAKESR